MKMLGIFCSTNVADNEELKKKLKVKNTIMFLFLIAGISVILAAAFYEKNDGAFKNGVTSSFYYGVGCGIIAAAFILIIRNLSVMKSETKLTEMRVNITDERNIAINSASIKASVAIMLTASFIISFASGICTIHVTKAILFLIMLFLFSYIVSYRVISTRI